MAEAAAATIPVEPIIDPGDIQTVLPGLDDEAAQRAALLASLAVATYLHPCPVPDPLPLPVYSATLILAVRSAGATANPGEAAVVSESIGSYSYHLSQPLTAEAALAVPSDVARMLDPYSCGAGGVFDVSVLGGSPYSWPVDWWQRDLDNVVAARDEAAS